MVILMGYVGTRARAVPHVMEAALLGDGLWAYVFVKMVNEHGLWTPSSLFSAFVTVFLAVSRISFFIARWSIAKATAPRRSARNTPTK
jgi:hypothetical protein